MQKICAIIVAYKPKEEIFKTLYSIINQVERIFIIDNTPLKSYKKVNKDLIEISKKNKKIKILTLKRNLGLGYALNKGLELAIKENFKWCLLSDQDTIYPKNYISEMLKCYNHSKKILAIAPVFFDVNKSELSKIVTDRFFFTKKQNANKIKKDCILCLESITSGLLCNIDLIKKENHFFNTQLFLDFTDLDWCWRAKNKNMKVVCNTKVQIIHTLGEKPPKNMLIKFYYTQNLLRYFLIVRNSIYLSLYSKEIPLKIRLNLLLRGLKYLFFFPLLHNRKKEVLKLTLKGFLLGIIGRLKNEFD